MEEKHADLNKTSNEREFNDIAKFPVGKTCPITRSDSDPKDNQFKAQIVYELPPSETVSAGSNECLTVCAAKPGSLWVLVSQLKTEIHSFSESPPSDVSKYHKGPFGQRPQGP